MSVNKDQALCFYRELYKIRHFELETIKLYRKGLISGNLHTYVGQEAVAVGIIQCLDTADVITSTHRCNGHFIARGSDYGKILAELMGKSTGYCRGKGGKLHLADMGNGIIGANGIVGAGMPIAAGAALQFKLSGDPRIAVAFFGDGAVNHGYFHETVNLAAVWQLPVLFVCENNSYAISTSLSRSLAVNSVVDRAAGYNIPAFQVDGTDVFAVYEVATEAVKHVRSRRGPVLLECLTVRMRGHHEGDGQEYRTAEELEGVKQRDPLEMIVPAIMTTCGVTEEELASIRQQVEAEISTAVDYAMASPPPTSEDLLTDIFSQGW